VTDTFRVVRAPSSDLQNKEGKQMALRAKAIKGGFTDQVIAIHRAGSRPLSESPVFIFHERPRALYVLGRRGYRQLEASVWERKERDVGQARQSALEGAGPERRLSNALGDDVTDFGNHWKLTNRS
jgi:hypothetical protein